MKTKITLLLVTFLILCSCVKDYHGHGPKEIEFTPTNFIYEGDMLSFYLNNEVENLNQIIEKLKKISPKDHGYEQAQKDIIAAETKQKDFQNQIAGIVDLSQLGFKIDPDIPRPPCNCFGVSNAIENILNVEGNNIVSMSVLDKTGKKTFSTIISEFSPLPEYNNALLVQEIKIFDLGIKGEIKISVAKKDVKGDIFKYTIDAFIK